MPVLKHNRQELFVYLLIWGILFLLPIVGRYVSVGQHADMLFQWADVFFVWRQFALFLVVFLVHNFLLAPLLVERQRRWLYFSLAAMLVAAFVVVQCSSRPSPQHPDGEGRDGHRPRMERIDDRQRPGDMPPPEWGDAPDGQQDLGAVDAPSMPMPDHKPGMGPRHEAERPPFVLGQLDVVTTIMLILMLGMNLGVKLYFRQRDDRQRMAQLEKQSLEQQLQYLRYQINPHFLMNTLNNIHALVDIDAERAKESIVGLSKIMRFVLYDGARQTVPLGRELAFTQDYIELMRLRLTDRVKVCVSMPERVPDGQLPPLVLITFVENAFKHGVSYRQDSFIDIAVQVSDGQLHFACRNSKAPRAEGQQQGGVGLRNARQRLDLIYGQRYTLRIDDQPDTYNIQLAIPLLNR